MLEQLKNDIAELVEQQKQLKPQRKTVNFVGERWVSPSGIQITATDATSMVASNKFKLRHLYIVYGLLRGKSLDEIEPNRTTPPSDWHIERFRLKYQLVEVPTP